MTDCFDRKGAFIFAFLFIVFIFIFTLLTTWVNYKWDRYLYEKRKKP